VPITDKCLRKDPDLEYKSIHVRYVYQCYRSGINKLWVVYDLSRLKIVDQTPLSLNTGTIVAVIESRYQPEVKTYFHGYMLPSMEITAKQYNLIKNIL